MEARFRQDHGTRRSVKRLGPRNACTPRVQAPVLRCSYAVTFASATGNRILSRDDRPTAPRCCAACQNQRFNRARSRCRSRTKRRRSGPSPPGGTNERGWRGGTSQHEGLQKEVAPA